MKRSPAFTIVYEDEHIVIVNKSAGVAVLADRWDDSKDRLDELLNSYYAEHRSARTASDPRTSLPFPHRVFVVHRLDRDTSGLVLFAKHAAAHRALSAAFEERSVEKHYVAVVQGLPSWKETVCDLPLRLDGDREHRTVIDNARGKPSVTHFSVAGSYGHLSIVKARLETGRTHQIRVHLAALGHPIACDPLYGQGRPIKLSSFKKGWRGDPFDERPLIERLALHAATLALPSVGTGNQTFGPYQANAPFPRDFAALLSQLQKAAGESFSLE